MFAARKKDLPSPPQITCGLAESLPVALLGARQIGNTTRDRSSSLQVAD